MPSFKHPCPYCGKFIDKVVKACPFCGQVDPFAPKRCLNCHKIVEDDSWVTCPSCGQSLIAPPPPPPGTVAPGTTAAAAGVAGTAGPTCPNCGYTKTPPGKPNCYNCGKPLAAAPAVEAPPPPRPPLYVDPVPAAKPVASGGPCSGCGSPLPAGARFCTICGTVAS